LVQGFDRYSASHGHLIRKLLRDNREAFYADTIEILQTGDESRGARYLISVLASDNLLLRALCDPALTMQHALALAQAAAQSGVRVDVVLGKHLSEQAPSIGNGVCPPEVQRLLEILAVVLDGSRVLPYLMALARQPNPHLQSKAVLMIGRVNHNVKWVQSRLMEPDARVRANAIEALWGIDTEEARGLLRLAGRDGDNRVAGNALIALYRVGDFWAIPELLKMADHESRRFRATAAWVMGETGDPRFTKTLARLLGEPSIAVRNRAFAALGQIRAATARARQARAWRIAARLVRYRRRGWREFHLDVASNEEREQIRVLPTQLIVLEDGQEVVSYSLEERPSEDDAAPAVAQVCLGWQARYLVRYPATIDARELRIVVNTPPGWGEVTLAIPTVARTGGE
jgi:hypothetical protein